MAYVKPRLLGADNPYGAEHQRTRKAWAPLVARGFVQCRRASNGTCIAASPYIAPTDRWQLGHPDETCPASRAPEHAACNLATNMPERRLARATGTRHSRNW